jgi:hypothetical protein
VTLPVDQLSSREKLTSHRYGRGGGVVSAPSTHAGNLPTMLAMWAGWRAR